MARVVELLGGRYELEELVGSGGMGEVFRARDLLLDRVVAVKRPSAAFTGSSRERFRREARAAARLNHPHVVAVYDWGETGPAPDGDGRDSSYIVMEHVEGRSLRAILREQGALEPGEAARIGAQIADALAHAHSKGIVHRDVKPSNVLITTAGSVKVTDFGIAQSTAAEALTEPGMVVGTAGYLAPEQVAGLTADARSDIYSLGVVLVELLRGARPDVDSTIADAPVGTTELERVIAKARAIDPAERYQRAVELREDLRDCARTAGTDSAASGPAVAYEPLTGVVVDVPTATVASSATATVAEPTKVLAPPPRAAPAPPPVAPSALGSAALASAGPAALSAPSAPASAHSAPASAPSAPAAPASAPSAPAAPASAPLSPEREPAAPSQPGSSRTVNRAAKRARKREARQADTAARRATAAKPLPKQVKAKRERRWRTPHVVWLVAAPVAVAVVAAGVLAYRALTDVPDVTVPSVVGRDVFSAVAVLDQAGFDVESVVKQSAQPGGTILAQRPRDGLQIPEGDTIVVVVSDIRAEMPDVVGMQESEAAAELRDVGLVNIEPTDDFRDDVEPGTVISSDPLAHQGALKAGTVVLKVARDPNVAVPNVVTMSEADARAELEARGLVVLVQPTSHSTIPAGQVISSSPAADKISRRGTTVTLKVSSGPEIVGVPNVVGDDVDDAIDELQNDGFAVSVVTTPATGRDVDRVIAQNPGAGGRAPEGSTVTITVGARVR